MESEALEATTLATYLHVLHNEGYWITTWIPTLDGHFECCITNYPANVHGVHWGADFDPLVALRQAMDQAGLP